MKTERELWLRRLAEFVVIANKKTYAGEGTEVKAQRPGYTELQWPYETMSAADMADYKGWEDWLFRDSYTGYYRAPGTSIVYYKGKPAWTQSYGGLGQSQENYDLTKPTFDFLKEVLMKATLELPFRGPLRYLSGDRKWLYDLELKGDIENCTWREGIYQLDPRQRVFSQTGFAGIVVDVGPDGKPLYPWNL